MKFLSVSLIYVAFFGLIGTAVYLTKSGWPLWALLLAPSVETKTKEKKSKSP